MSGVEAALAAGVLKTAGGKLVSLISSEFTSITGVKKDLCELQGKHQEISSWLAVVRDRALGSGTQLPWVNELRNVAYDIEDLLYGVHLEAEKDNIQSDGDKQPIADYFCAKPKSLLFRCKVASKIKAIKVKYEKIVKHARDANIIRNNLQMDHPARSSYTRTAGEPSMLSNVEDSKIPRRDQEKDEIVSKILEPNEGEDGRTVVSIVGLGGSGKTTLAKQICHDKKIMENFKDMIFWVYVSQEFDGNKLIGKLFEAIIEEKSDLHVQQKMLREISNKLSGKKFLLVLDDAWHQNKHDWEHLMVHLKSGAVGSKILLTTRDRKVAEIVKSRHIFKLGMLSEAESWSLFLKSSGWVEEDLGSEYIEVGKVILNRCSGVPLAIRTLGGILYENKEISIWKAIGQSDLWTDESIEDRVFASLKLSFIHLPDELKQCFTLCSIFPKGTKIYKDRLISQWVAHGFINSMNGKQPEDMGSGYVDSLVKVGFLQDPSEDQSTKQLVCKMHDLIHDLTRHILQDEVVTCIPNNMIANRNQRCRYLSLTSCPEKVHKNSFHKAHALFISRGNPIFDKPVMKSSSVRSVVLDYTENTPFPQFTLKFEYIGYLEIHNLGCTKFLEAISSCLNLQSLHLIKCKGLVALPESIGKLKKLRILELNFAYDLDSLPQSIGDCRHLQSLILYRCGKFREMPGTICKIKNLRGLHISSCSFLKLKQFPSEFAGVFSNLQTINLANSIEFQGLPSTLSCPLLCTLDLSKTKVTMLPPWITTIDTLECINLEQCSELVELPKGIGNLKRLAVLNIKGCTKLRCMPSGIGQLTRLTQLALFVVGCDRDDARISELENLDISGELEIRNLKYVKDPCDTEKACLKQKNGIKNLVLDWSLSEGEEELASDVEQEQGVLSGLEPPSQIESLVICRYQGPCLPRWLMEQNGSSYSEGTTLKQTGPCQYPSLTYLTLSRSPNLKMLPDAIQHLTSLESLKLICCRALVELPEGIGQLYALRQLGIDRCSALERLPQSIQHLPDLQSLVIDDCPALASRYKEGVGPDWHLVSHIPHVWIDPEED
ncbi:disease resistance protein RGA2-like [Panicum virgatum]|nr:disease resistance protein RGA2-like [Panicum virgatum]